MSEVACELYNEPVEVVKQKAEERFPNDSYAVQTVGSRMGSNPEGVKICLGINMCMAYSKKVLDRFNAVVNNPEAHSVGRFDPNDPNVETGMEGVCPHLWRCNETAIKT